MTRTLTIICLILTVVNAEAFAQTATPEKMLMDVVNEQFGSIGVSAQFKFENVMSLLVITVDQDTFGKSRPMLIKRGLLSKNVDERDLSLRPYSMGMSAALQLSALCLEQLYNNLPNLDNAQVMVFSANRNSYGKVVRRLGEQFFFDRKLAMKIDWEHSDYRNLVVISQEFHVEEWLLEETAAEMKFWRPR